MWVNEDEIRAYIEWYSAIIKQLNDEEREEKLDEN